MTSARALHVAAGVLAVVALAFRFTGTVVAAASSAPVVAPPAAAGAGVVRPDPELFQEIVAANVFATDRAAPRGRYLPHGGADSAGAEPDTALPPRAREAPSGPRLSGIVITPQATVALIETDGGIAGVKVYQVGDTVAGGRVAAITDSTVVLGGARGRRVLRLHSRATQSYP